MRLLRLDRQHVARRHQTDVQLVAHVGQVRVVRSSAWRTTSDARERDTGQERARNVQLQIGAGGLAILSRCLCFGARRARQRLSLPPV